MDINIALVTGEASADAQMASLIPHLRSTLVGLGYNPHLWGIGGPLLRGAGFEAVARVEDLNVLGFVEVLASYPRVRGILQSFLEEVARRRPQLVILVDFPGFNLRLLPSLYTMGLTVLYHIPPKVWAHGWGRVHTLARYTHGVSSVLPFEEELFVKEGVHARFVGNPLFSRAFSSRGNRASPPPPTGVRTVGVLPGSRTAEVKALLPLMVEALHGLALKDTNRVRGVLPLAPTLDEGWVQQLALDTTLRLGRDPRWLNEHLSITRAPLATALGPCQYAWVCSGTATLEVCALGVPHAVVYKMHPLSYMVAKRIIRVGHVGLGNLCAFDGDVAPELLQESATAEALVSDALLVFKNPEEAKSRLGAMEAVAHRFPQEPERRAARFFAEVMEAYLMAPPLKFRKHRDMRALLLGPSQGVP